MNFVYISLQGGKMKKLIVLAGIFAISGFACAGKYAASIDGKKIKKSEIEKTMWTTCGQVTLQNAINEKIMLEKAKKLGITADENELENQYKEIAAQYGSQDEFEKALKERYLTTEELKEQIKRHQIKTNLVIMLENISVTDKEAEKFFEQNEKIFSRPALVLLRQIIVNDKKQADQIWAELGKEGGRNFQKLAKEKSLKIKDEAGVEIEPGKAVWVSDERLIKKVADIVFQLKPGQYTKPIETLNGWYLLKIEDKKDRIPAVYNEETKNAIKQNILRSKISRAMPKFADKLRKEKEIKIYY